MLTAVFTLLDIGLIFQVSAPYSSVSIQSLCHGKNSFYILPIVLLISFPFTKHIQKTLYSVSSFYNLFSTENMGYFFLFCEKWILFFTMKNYFYSNFHKSNIINSIIIQNRQVGLVVLTSMIFVVFSAELGVGHGLQMLDKHTQWSSSPNKTLTHLVTSVFTLYINQNK